MSEFERWEERFAAPGYLFGTEPNAFLKCQAHLLKPGWKVLSVADGEGRNGVWLAEQGLDVDTFDFSPKAMAKARELARARGVTVRTERVDLFQYKWPNAAYDVIAAIFFQFAGPDTRAAVFAGIKRALKPGGLLLMQGYRVGQLKYGTGGPANPDHHWTRALIEEFFSDMSSLDITEHDSVIREGEHHLGMSALIDVVARK
jgi:cyclopropane fatty-acyl-phospholipid synthase-like methyltransferase